MMPEVLAFEMDTRQIERDLALCKKQIPYALAVSLTKTAQAAQGKTIHDMPAHFTMRTDYYTNPKKPGGWRVVPAKKDRLEAQVGTRGALMEQEVFGGVKAAGPGAKGVEAVPTEAGKGSTKEALRGPDKKKELTKRAGKWPRQLQKRGGFFVARMKSGQKIMFQKTGNPHPAARPYRDLAAGREVFPRLPVQAVYVFEPTVKIKARFPFPKIIEEVVARQWPKEVEYAVVEALFTAR